MSSDQVLQVEAFKLNPCQLGVCRWVIGTPSVRSLDHPGDNTARKAPRNRQSTDCARTNGDGDSGISQWDAPS